MQYLTDADLAGERGAHISDCGTYRYRLWRSSTDRPMLVRQPTPAADQSEPAASAADATRVSGARTTPLRPGLERRPPGQSTISRLQPGSSLSVLG
jgi:hypothetical protein